MTGQKYYKGMWKGNRNKGKVLYKCIDCGEQAYLWGHEMSRRNGNKCMGCGGLLEASSLHAKRREIVRGSRPMPETGSILIGRRA